MSSHTPNLSLILPIGQEYVSRAVFNGNMTLIDAAYGTLNGNLEYFRTSPNGFSKQITGSTADVNTNGFYWCENTSDTPSQWGYLIVSHHASVSYNNYKQIFCPYNTQQIYVRTFINGSVVGSGWEELALNSKIPIESKTYQFTSVPYVNGSGARCINCPVPLNKTPIITSIQSSGGVDVTGDFDIVHNSEGQLFVYTWVATFDGVPINVNYHF